MVAFDDNKDRKIDTTLWFISMFHISVYFIGNIVVILSGYY